MMMSSHQAIHHNIKYYFKIDGTVGIFKLISTVLMGVIRLILRNASASFFYQVFLRFLLLEENLESGENLVQNDIKTIVIL